MLRRIKWLFFLCILFLIAGILAALWFLPGTFTAKATPPAWEIKIARFIRHMATPSHFLKMSNPIRFTPEILAEARHHFADHCATCHANDGSGKTAMGPNFYPPVPDLRDPSHPVNARWRTILRDSFWHSFHRHAGLGQRAS